MGFFFVLFFLQCKIERITVKVLINIAYSLRKMCDNSTNNAAALNTIKRLKAGSTKCYFTDKKIYI